IGSGAGGAAAAHILCKSGLNVLVLEAGPNRFIGLDEPDGEKFTTTLSNDELKLDRRSFIKPKTLVDPRTFRPHPSMGQRTFVGDVTHLPKTVGGGTVHADLKMPHFGEDDFHLGTLLGDVMGASFADWPVDYAMLEPFYGYVERLLGVQGKEGAHPFEPPR